MSYNNLLADDDDSNIRLCELCEKIFHREEMHMTDIGLLCISCFDDCKCSDCYDFLPPEETVYINDDEGKLLKICSECF